MDQATAPPLGRGPALKVRRFGRNDYERVGRWTFWGTVGRPRGCHGLRTLHWELSGNALDPAQARSHEYRTAFAFEHSRRPVVMRVEIDGRLRSKGRQLKHRLLRFSSGGRGRDRLTLTYMDLSRAADAGRSLDRVAQGLDAAMQWPTWSGRRSRCRTRCRRRLRRLPTRIRSSCSCSSCSSCGGSSTRTRAGGKRRAWRRRRRR